MTIKLEKSLDFDEFTAAKEAYEKCVGFWMPVDDVKEQIMWMAAFEQAKKIFKER